MGIAAKSNAIRSQFAAFPPWLKIGIIKTMHAQYCAYHRAKFANRMSDPLKRDRRRALDRARSKSEKHRAYAREYERKRYATNPQFMLARRLRNRIRKLAQRGKAGRGTMEILGCSFEQFKDHIASRFEKGMSWKNYGLWHIDHTEPCANFDLTDPNQVKQCFHFSNMRPLWATHNHLKGNSPVTHQKELLLCAAENSNQ